MSRVGLPPCGAKRHYAAPDAISSQVRPHD